MEPTVHYVMDGETGYFYTTSTPPDNSSEPLQSPEVTESVDVKDKL